MNTPYEVTPQYSFTVEQNGDTHIFTYKRTKYSAAMYVPLFIFCFIVIMLITSVFARHMSSGILPAIIVPAIICLAVSRSRSKGQFEVSPTHITIDSKAYNRGHISRIYFELPSKYYNNVEIRRGLRAPTDALRSRISSQIEAKNYIVGFVYAEKHIKLAGGLNETSAHVLYDRIKDILKIYY